MTSAPVAAARNTNFAVEGENLMTDAELQKLIQDVCESIDSLPKSDKPLSKEERKRREVLLLKKEVLGKIKEAREKNEKDNELYNTMVYGLLISVGEKHPYLASLLKSNIRWSMF